MALVIADRVKETTITTGTGAITLAGAATGYQAFSAAIGNGNTTYYCIADQAGANWEVGFGTYSSTGNTLTRTTVVSSSNANSLVNFSAGTKDVFVTIPALAGSPLVGSIAVFGTGSAPQGWIKANGAAISRTAYAALFSMIGTTFGTGDGSTTFNVPDLRGEFIRGWDDGRGADSGRTFGSYQADDFKSHSHVEGMTGPGTISNQLPSGGGSWAWTASILSTGNTGGTETRPRNIALLACIKY